VLTPAVVIADRLATARRGGETFHRAWPDALEEALATAPDDERREWGEVCVEMVSTWRAAYERREQSESARPARQARAAA